MTQATPIPLVAHSTPELLQQQGEPTHVAEKLAQDLTDVCAHAEQHLAFAVQSRQEQQAAWLALCDRGWPTDVRPETVPAAMITPWLDAWTAMVALPVKVWMPQDLYKLQQVRKRLAQAEQRLNSLLPPAVWTIVVPLDDTGRATLAYVLHALHAWHEATTRCAAASRIKEALIQRFGEFARQAAALSIRPARAPLDLDGWRGVAVDARLAAEQYRHRRNEVRSGDFPLVR